MEKQLTELSFNEVWRYTSQIKLCEVGLEGQKKLKSASVAVIGAGGLGCASLLYLAAAGVGKIGIIDHDRIEMSNLQRQILYHQEDVGRFKCDVAKKKLSLINPHTVFNSIETFLTTKNSKEIIQDYDVVIDATDNFPARYAINDACLEISKPFIYGSIHHFEGQVAIFNALEADGIRGPDYRSLYPVPPIQELAPSCAGGGVIAPLPGIIGSIQALEAIKLILDIGETLSGKLFKIDSLTWSTRLYQIGSRPKPKENPIEISAETVHQMLLEKVDLQLIDLRKESERLTNFDASCVPFSKLMEHPIQIPFNKVTILYCQKGIRSIQAAKMLRKRFNFQKIYSLQGGIAAFNLPLRYFLNVSSPKTASPQ
jgi:sulfur-carrier protein adenylyltransferase/sulfurtransferase